MAEENLLSLLHKAYFGALPTRSLGGVVEVASHGEGAVTPTSPDQLPPLRALGTPAPGECPAMLWGAMTRAELGGFHGTLHASFSQRCQTQAMKFLSLDEQVGLSGHFLCRCISSRKAAHACLSPVSSRWLMLRSMIVLVSSVLGLIIPYLWIHKCIFSAMAKVRMEKHIDIL